MVAKRNAFALLSLSVFLVFSAYVFLNARLEDRYGDMVLVFLVFLALPRLLEKQATRYRNFFICLFWAYLSLTLSSVLFPPTQYANLSWLVIALYRLIFSFIIVFSLLNQHEADHAVLRWGLSLACLALALLHILQQYGVSVQGYLSALTPLRLDNSEWHVKNYAFWQLLLMWGAVALLWRRNPLCGLFAILIAIISLWAIFLTTSESSKLAAVISVVVFVAAHLANSRRWYFFYYLGIMASVLGPFLWVCAAPVRPLLSSSLPKLSAIVVRLQLYDYVASLIKKEFVFGYGFGSTLFMPVPKGEVGPWIIFPGGHPHNFTFLFFIDHGILGFIFLALMVSLLIHYLFNATVGKDCAPGIWALLVAGLVLFSLSYSIWKADVVLMYCMWLGLLFAIASDGSRPVAVWLENKILLNAVMFFGLLAFIIYSADYLFLAGK